MKQNVRTSDSLQHKVIEQKLKTLSYSKITAIDPTLVAVSHSIIQIFYGSNYQTV